MSTYGSRLAEKAHEPGKAMRWLWLSLLLLFVDQASKYLASTMLAHGESVPAAPFFNWVHRHNTGAAFSFLSDAGGWQRWFFTIVSLALVGGLAAACFTKVVGMVFLGEPRTEHARQATAAQNAVTEMTNNLLRQNADLLKTGTIDTAREAERSIVDLETLRHTNQQLMESLDEVLRIQTEGTQKRREAEAELGRIEGELKQKLLALRT